MALKHVCPKLIAACQGGESQSIEQLIQEISPDLYRILFSMLRDHDDTDEVLQETLIRIFRYIHSLKEVKKFPSWVMRVAVNQVQTFRVKKGRTRLYDLENMGEVSDGAIVLGGTTPEDPSHKLMREQMRREITEAMEALPDRQRMATMLFEIEGLSIREIAESLQCSEGAIKFNIHEGRKKLKRRLSHMIKDLRWGRRRAVEDASSNR